MRRIQRLNRTARREAVMALVLLSGGCAAAIWALVAVLLGAMGWAAALVAASAAGLLLGMLRAMESGRVRRLAGQEKFWEEMRGSDR